MILIKIIMIIVLLNGNYTLDMIVIYLNLLPDPKQPKLNFQVILFSHSILPIHDYIYKGERHRWIDESNLRGFKARWQVKYGFKHTYLIDGQPALTDNWDGKSDKLNKDKNPYLDNF